MENKDKSISIVLPTFNEKDNVGILVEKIATSFVNSGFCYEIIFVDDSNDETPILIRREIDRNSFVRLLNGPRKGLAPAFLKGFETAEGKYICCIDADLQHPPEKIIELLKLGMSEDADIVVCTRYAKGGSATGLGKLNSFYGLYRRAVSLLMKYLTQIIFIQTRKTSDPLGGFFVFKKKIISGVRLQPKGFKILVEILMRARYDKVDELGYTFLPRKNNESKATIKQGMDFFCHLWYIFKTVPEAGRFLKFCFVGLSGVFVNLGILTILVEIFKQDKDGIAYILAILISILTNYSLNSIFTYGDKRSESREESIRRMLYYYIIAALVMFINYGLYLVFLSLGIFYLLAAFLAIVFSTALNFFLVTKIVWRMKIKI